MEPSDKQVEDGVFRLLKGERSEEAQREVEAALAFSLAQARALDTALRMILRPMPKREDSN